MKKETAEELPEHFKLKYEKLINKLIPESKGEDRGTNERWNAKRQRRTLMEAQLYEVTDELKRQQDDDKEKRKKANARRWANKMNEGVGSIAKWMKTKQMGTAPEVENIAKEQKREDKPYE